MTKTKYIVCTKILYFAFKGVINLDTWLLCHACVLYSEAWEITFVEFWTVFPYDSTFIMLNCYFNKFVVLFTQMRTCVVVDLESVLNMVFQISKC